jgi:hypothetical protein
MKIATLISAILFCAFSAHAQFHFEKARVSDSILNDVHQLNAVTIDGNHWADDSLRAHYAYLISMRLPFASGAELLEITNHPNKHVRMEAFSQLLWRDRDTILLVLEKNQVDTIDKIEVMEGCMLRSVTVFQLMLERTICFVKMQEEDEKLHFYTEQKLERWKTLQALVSKSPRCF